MLALAFTTLEAWAVCVLGAVGVTLGYLLGSA
jgi:hypothetical protein